MADRELFPVFDVPEVITPTQPDQEHYRPSVYFDFTTGDFLRDGANRMIEADGREAYMQWCMKIIATERDGVDMVYAMSRDTREAVQSAVERTVTEALMVNPKTESVSDFVFTWEGSSLYGTFAVKALDLDEIRLSVAIETQ